MKIKIQKLKFLRNIIIGVIALLIVSFIINIAPGYKRNKYKDVTNLVIGDKNVTEKLQKPIYKDENGTIYISKEDIKELLDKTIFYDKQNDMIIATSEVSVASMKVGEKVIDINGSTVNTIDTVIRNNNTLYIPIYEMEIVYNIEVQYLEEENIVIIDKLNEGMIKAEATEKTKVRFKSRTLSKQVDVLEEGDVVSAFYTTSKGWRVIRTSNGTIGYVKANTLTNEYILRQDMKQKSQTKTIETKVEDGTVLNVEGKDVIIKDLFKVSDEGILIKNTEISNDENIGVWANLTPENINLKNYSNRSTIIKNIASLAMKNNISGINVTLNKQDENLERFVIELAPKLREIGVITNIIIENNVEEEKYIDIVEYIIK